LNVLVGPLVQTARRRGAAQGERGALRPAGAERRQNILQTVFVGEGQYADGAAV